MGAIRSKLPIAEWLHSDSIEARAVEQLWSGLTAPRYRRLVRNARTWRNAGSAARR
jgi:hypothetical protein